MRSLVGILILILLVGSLVPASIQTAADDYLNGNCPTIDMLSTDSVTIEPNTFPMDDMDGKICDGGSCENGTCTPRSIEVPQSYSVPQQSRPMAPQVQSRSVRQGILPKARPVRGLFRRLFRR